jgi:hypothetical protein
MREQINIVMITMIVAIAVLLVCEVEAIAPCMLRRLTEM